MLCRAQVRINSCVQSGMNREIVLPFAAVTVQAFVSRNRGSTFGNFFDDDDMPGSKSFRDCSRQAVKIVTSVVKDLFLYGIRVVLRAKQRGDQTYAATQ
jgi:hypothetical protein